MEENSWLFTKISLIIFFMCSMCTIIILNNIVGMKNVKVVDNIVLATLMVLPVILLYYIIYYKENV